MGFFDYFFSNSKTTEGPKIQFGRFSDAYKDEEKYDAWDRALELFDEQDYLESYKSFFHYLSDESADNCVVVDHRDHITFEVFQGSKKIVGTANQKRITAEAKIAQTTDLHIGFLRKLLEDNYQLKYCRYALDPDDCLTAVFSSGTIDGSPYKLYYALKELATYSDKKDDILISEFSELHAINNTHIRIIESSEIQIKYKYLTDEIDHVLNKIDQSTLNINHYPGAAAYLYLDLLYRIDYLIKPEGIVMEVIDNTHNLYFHNKIKSPDQKNRKIRRALQQIRATTYENFSHEIYEVKSTFGITQPSGLIRIQEFIASELKNMDWYYANGHEEFALAIPSYIIGYSLFNYSMPPPMRDLFNLYYQILVPEYFKSLGIDGGYRINQALKPARIRKGIKSIISLHHDDYPALDAAMKELQYRDMCAFAKSYLLMVQGMDFQRKDQR